MTKEFGFSGAIAKLNKISSNAKTINSIVEKEAEEIFYSESNMKYLEKIITDIESGKAKLVEHDLIEE